MTTNVESSILISDSKSNVGGNKIKIISSQRYRDEEKCNQDVDIELSLPVYNVKMDDLFILADGHHRLASYVNKYGNMDNVSFYVVKNDTDLTGTDLLDRKYMDGDYYYINNETAVSVDNNRNDVW